MLKPEAGLDGSQLVPCEGSWGSSKSAFVRLKPFYPVTAWIFYLFIKFFSLEGTTHLLRAVNDLVQVFLKPLGRSSLELFPLCFSPPGCVSECPDPGNNGDDNHRSALAALPLEGIISCAEHPIQPNPAANPVV